MRVAEQNDAASSLKVLTQSLLFDQLVFRRAPGPLSLAARFVVEDLDFGRVAQEINALDLNSLDQQSGAS